MRVVTLNVNGQRHALEVEPSTPLIYVLRNDLHLTGVKLGCGLEQCGACAVLVDNVSTLCCVTPVEQFEGKKIITVEGLTEHGRLSRVQRAFVEEGAAQCGYCTPGMVIAATALLWAVKNPSERKMREALSPHLCRCGSHGRVLAAVRSAAGRMGR